MTSLILPTYDDVAAAARTLDGHAHRTPVLSSRTANEELGAELYGGEHSLRLYRKRHEGPHAGSGGTRAWAGRSE